MGELYGMCKYESADTMKHEYKVWSLFDISEHRKAKLKDIPDSIVSRKGEPMMLVEQLRAGNMLLIYEENKDELQKMDSSRLAERLYVIEGFESNGKRIKLKKAIHAKRKTGNGVSIKILMQCLIKYGVE